MRKLYLDRFLNHEIPTDILQEALPNVVAAHVMQSYIGGYGNMVQPVSACATAAVSLEEGADKIALGKADFVVTGAIDDIGVESVIGFGNMNATANSEEMYAKASTRASSPVPTIVVVADSWNPRAAAPSC